MLLAQGNWLYAGSGLNAGQHQYQCSRAAQVLPIHSTLPFCDLPWLVTGVNPSDRSEPLNSPNHLHVGGDSQIA